MMFNIPISQQNDIEQQRRNQPDRSVDFEGDCNSPEERMLKIAKFLEFFDDDNFSEMDEFLQNYGGNQKSMKFLLQLKNYDGRTPLHMICQNGSKKQFDRIIKLITKHYNEENTNTKEITMKTILQSLDENNDTPLNLAFSHGSHARDDLTQQFKVNQLIDADRLRIDGKMEMDQDFVSMLKFRFEQSKLNQLSTYDREMIEKQLHALNHKNRNNLRYIFFLEDRFRISSNLIEQYKNNELHPNYKSDKNNHLHWAIYHGDFAAGFMFYQHFKSALFLKNEKGLYPLELLLKTEYTQDIKLYCVKMLITRIIYDLLNRVLQHDEFGNNQELNDDEENLFLNKIRKLVNTRKYGRVHRIQIAKYLKAYIHIDNQKRFKTRTLETTEQFLNVFKNLKNTQKNYHRHYLSKMEKDIEKKINRKSRREENEKNMGIFHQGSLTKHDTQMVNEFEIHVGTVENLDHLRGQKSGQNLSAKLGGLSDGLGGILKTKQMQDQLINVIKEEFEEEVSVEDDIDQSSESDASENSFFSKEGATAVIELQNILSSKIVSEKKMQKQLEDSKRKQMAGQLGTKLQELLQKQNQENEENEQDKALIKQSIYQLLKVDDSKNQDMQYFQTQNMGHVDNTQQNQEEKNQYPMSELSLLRDNKSQMTKDHGEGVFLNDDPDFQPIIVIDGPNLTEMELFMHRILVMAIHVDNNELVQILIQVFELNPFIPCLPKDQTPFQYACQKGRKKIIVDILKSCYKGKNANSDMNIRDKIKKKTGIDENCALHYASQNNKMEIYEILRKYLELDPIEKVKKEYLHLFNYEGYDCLEMSKEENFVKHREKLLNSYEREVLLNSSYFFARNGYSDDIIYQINEGYQYMVQGISIEEDGKNSLIYKQLINIQQTWLQNLYLESEKIDIQVFRCQNQTIPGIGNLIKKVRGEEIKNLYKYNYLIKFPDTVIAQIADYLNIQMYHRKFRYMKPFTTQDRKDFVQFKDFHVHSLIEYILNKEFNIKFYQNQNIILKIMPLHEFRTRDAIATNWNKEKFKIFLNFWKFKTSAKDIRPINALAFYYGCDYAFYMSFLINMTLNVFILTVVGALCLGVNWIIDKKYAYDNRFTPIYALVVAVWVIYILKQTVRREKELAKAWKTQNYQNYQIQRIEYKGQYSINKVSNQIFQKDFRSVFMRRVMLELILIIIGCGIIIGTFLAVTYFNDWVDDQFNLTLLGQDHNTSVSIYKVFGGIVNGIAIVIFTIVFRKMAEFICEKENHRFQSKYDNSFIIKNFLFNFFLNYTNLFYYTYFKQDISTLSSIYGSLLFSKNLMFFLIQDVLPYLIFRFNKRSFEKEWLVKRQEMKEKYYDELGVEFLTESEIETARNDFSMGMKSPMNELKDIRQLLQKEVQRATDAQQKKNDINKHNTKSVKPDKCKKDKYALDIDGNASPYLQQFVNSCKNKNMSDKEITEKLYKMLHYEKDIILMEQVELSLLMPLPLFNMDLWMFAIIQFGFITCFSIVQPIINFWSSFMNLVHIFYSYWAFVNHTQRNQCLERDSMGVWSTILKFMVIIALINNLGILIFTSEGLSLLFRDGEGKYKNEDLLLNLIFWEHLAFIILFLVFSMTSDIPQWVTDKLKREKLRRNLNEDRSKVDELKQFLTKQTIKRQNMFLKYQDTGSRVGESFAETSKGGNQVSLRTIQKQVSLNYKVVHEKQRKVKFL